MKKSVLFLFVLFSAICLFAQSPKTDAELKNYLVQNGFACFKFNSDGTYSYNQRLIGDSVFGEGTYSVSNGIINFETLKNNYYTPQYREYFSELMTLPGKYRLDLKVANINSQGALVNINDQNKKLWSDIPPKAYTKIIHNGVECIRYP